MLDVLITLVKVERLIVLLTLVTGLNVQSFNDFGNRVECLMF